MFSNFIYSHLKLKTYQNRPMGYNSPMIITTILKTLKYTPDGLGMPSMLAMSVVVSLGLLVITRVGILVKYGFLLSTLCTSGSIFATGTSFRLSTKIIVIIYTRWSEIQRYDNLRVLKMLLTKFVLSKKILLTGNKQLSRAGYMAILVFTYHSVLPFVVGLHIANI